MKKKNLNFDTICRYSFFVLATSVLLFFFFGIIFLPSERQDNIYDCGTDDLQWRQILPDKSEIPVKLPCKLDAAANETVCIKTIISEEMSEDVTRWLCLLSTLQDVEVHIDGELRKEYTTETTRPWGTSSASAYIFVPIAPDDGGKELAIYFTSDSAYSGVVHEMYVGTAFGIWYYHGKNNIFAFLLAAFMLVLSVISIVASVILSFKTKRKFYLYFLGCGLLTLSIWVLAQSPIRQLYYENVSLAGILTHITIFFFVIPIVLYLDYVQEKRYVAYYRGYLAVSLAYFMFAIVSEVTDLLPFRIVHTTNTIIQLIGVGIVIVTMIIDIRKGYIRNYKLIAYGILGLVVCAIIQLVLYFNRTVVFDGGILCIGTVFLLIMAMITTIKDYINLDSTIKNIRRKNETLTYQIMETLVHTIEAKDKYTKGHSTRVAEYSRLLAQKMGMTEEEQMSIYFMATLHDIGKISIDDRIINKPAKLTDEEYAVIKKHPEIGYNILKNMSEIEDIENGARWHHERYDGKGYPDGLSGEEIPLYARVIAVADTYDAMTSNRSYREVLPQYKVRAEIERVSGTQLDPIVAHCMMELIDEDKDYKLRQNNK
ncbi:MAG: HD domain-containing phosphohydrolase [Oscillospiraceae bacterium]